MTIKIDPANIPVDILGLHRFKTEEDAIYSKLVKCLDEPVEMQLESSLGEETLYDPLSEVRTPSMETNFLSELPSACEMEEGIVVAPGEGKKPAFILNDFYSLFLFLFFKVFILSFLFLIILNDKFCKGAWSSTSVSYWLIWLQS